MNPTAKQKAYWDRLANEIGCIACYNNGVINHYVSLHHILVNGKKDHDNVLPLCQWHHQCGGEGVAIHPFKRVWQQIHGSQEKLKLQCDKLLKENDEQNG